MNERPNEQRLEQLREKARQEGVVPGRGVNVVGGPIPRKRATTSSSGDRPGYYGEPVVKPPVWTWEIPLYFFIGGLGGMSPLIASAALLRHDMGLARAAMLLAAIAAVVSPILLVLDLGRPSRFIYMLRVFKWRSPMSVGAWILTGFSPCALAGLLGLELQARHIFSSAVIASLINTVTPLLIVSAALFGLGLATYTGVLLGATAIPAWNLHRRYLPMHFGVAGLGSASAALELLGYRLPALNALGFAVATIETALWIWLEFDNHGKADRAAHTGTSGWMIRIADLLTGPSSIVLRFLDVLPFAAAAFLIGALVSRFGWFAAGRASGRDPESVFASQSG